MSIVLTKSAELAELLVGAVEFESVEVAESSVELRTWSDAAARQSAAIAEQPEQEALRQRVRQMLRHGQFKASGRSKPAQEYLLRCAAQDGQLPNINAPVDILNTVSLECGLPISLLSITKCSPRLIVRRGEAGESYVFNATGQELNVTDLVVACDQSTEASRPNGRPVGSPIKDSMAGKIEASDTHLIAIVYAPVGCEAVLRKTCESLIENFSKYITGVRCTLLPVAE